MGTVRLGVLMLLLLPALAQTLTIVVRCGVRLTLWPDRRFNALMLRPATP